MKNILNKLVVLLLAGFALAACTEHTEYDDTGFSAVEKPVSYTHLTLPTKLEV